MTTIEKRILLASRLFLSLMLAAVVISCSKSMASADATGKPEAMSVRVAEILAETISIPIRISGTVRAHQESRLSFKTGGIIKDLFVDAGDRVEKGQLLARLDPEEIDQQVAQARIGMEKAQRDYDRIHNLYVDTVATLMQLQDAHSALDMARTALGIAEYNRNYSSIYAPSRGIILQKFMEEDEIAGTGNPVFFFASDEEAWQLTVGISDKDLVKLRMGDRATLLTDAYPDTPMEGRVAKIANAPEPTTGLYEVELALDNANRELKPGFFARGELYPSQQVTCWRLPVDALREGSGTSLTFFLFDQEQNVATEHRAEALCFSNPYVYIQSSEPLDSRWVITSVPRPLRHLDRVKVENNLAFSQPAGHE